MDYPKADTKIQSGPDILGLLQPGEQVLWQGQPNKSDVEGTRTLFLRILIAILATIILLYFTEVFMYGLLPNLLLIISLFVALGVTILTITNSKSNTNNNYYYLTNQRAIIMNGPLPATGEFRTTIIKLAQVDAVRLVNTPNGNGSISFGRREATLNRQYAATDDPDYTFSNIADVAHVYQLVQQAQLGAGKQD